MLAGLERISSGTIRIGDTVVNELPPRERNVAMVFQSYALYPHLSVCCSRLVLRARSTIELTCSTPATNSASSDAVRNAVPSPFGLRPYPQLCLPT
jgi:ABC-type thiamine transport system ATPase subunit